MKRWIAVLACLLIAGSTFAQARRRAVPPPSADVADSSTSTPVRGPWSVEITTTGGFAGSGSGDIRVDSSGRLVVGQFVPRGRQCEFILTPGDVTAIEASVLTARADLWVASYVPANEQRRCCDLILTKLRLQRSEHFNDGGRVANAAYTTEFLFQDGPTFPADLKALWRLLYASPDGYLARYAPTCR